MAMQARMMPAPSGDLDLINTVDAAIYLGLSPKTLERWRVTGGGPGYRKIGARVLYDRADLTAFANAGARQHTSQAAGGAR